MKDRILTVFTIVLFTCGLGTVMWVLAKSYLKNRELTTVGETTCVNHQVEIPLNDPLMAGILTQDQYLEVLFGYYKCNPVQRQELVYYRMSPPLDPVIRRVHGIPGDRFEVLDAGTARTYNLKINGELVKTQNQIFFFTSDDLPPLKTFEIARQGVLGLNEFIVFAEVPPGGSDSTALGIVKLTAFEGKVVVRD